MSGIGMEGEGLEEGVEEGVEEGGGWEWQQE